MISIRHIVYFPNHKIEKDSQYLRKCASNLVKNSDHSEKSDLERIYCYQVQFPDIASHSDHLVGSLAKRADQFVCKKVKNRIWEKMQGGVSNPSVIRNCVDDFVKEQLFAGKDPPKPTDRRYFPTDRDYVNIMNRFKKKLKLALFDQDNVCKLIEQWEKDFPEDNFFFRGYGELVDEAEFEKAEKTSDASQISIEKGIQKIDVKGDDLVTKICSQYLKGKGNKNDNVNNNKDNIQDFV